MTERNPEPKATLMTWTALPMECVYAVWEQSKTRCPLRTPQQIQDEVDPEEVRSVFRRVIAQGIPISQHIDFVFVIENNSISWREQAVRHVVGTLTSPDRIGIDMVPELGQSRFWAQSMTIMDMGTFFDEGRYRLPESIKDHQNPVLALLYDEAMEKIQLVYNTLVESGIPREDARELIPLGAQHRMSWKLNIAALQHIMKKRSCWIMQLGVWGPILRSMIRELAEKIDPIFRELATPPCIKVSPSGEDTFTGCVLMEECRRRLSGEDDMAPCPLHLNHHVAKEDHKGKLPLLVTKHPDYTDLPNKPLMMKRIEQYTEFWGRDCYTGERIK